MLSLSFASLFGTYVVGGGIVNVLPGPIVCLFFIGGVIVSHLVRLRFRVLKIPYGGVFLCFLIYSVLVTLIIPELFSGEIQVIKPGYIAEDGVRGTNPLSLSVSNLAQITYVIFDFFIIYLLITYRLKNGNAIQGRVISFNVLVASMLSALVIIEFSFCMVGFNADLFSWFMGSGFMDPRPDRYALANALGLPIRRAQAIMGEPSFYSTYMAGVYGMVLYQLRIKPSAQFVVYLLLILSSLILAFSTTAIFSVFVISIAVFFIPTGSSVTKQSNRFVNKILVFLLGLILLCSIMYAVFSSEVVFDYIFGKLTNTDGYEEGNYSSGAERLYWDVTALGALANSYGLGVGAGSTRASSFLLNFMAAFGGVGLVAFLALGYKFLKSIFSDQYTNDYMTKLSRILCLGWFIGFLISVPDAFSFFYVWIGIGIAMPLTTFSNEKQCGLRVVCHD